MKKVKFVVKWGLRTIVGTGAFLLFAFFNALLAFVPGQPFGDAFKIGLIVSLCICGVTGLLVGSIALYAWATED